jgi:DNA mismatch repair protein MutL
MSDVIKLLPDSVANQIAAGEVIQRPASVVKELVENAVDAGATEVQVIIKDAGRTLIQVVDNGCGMSATDARLAFERHSTSKIRQADDLFSLHTMGFRGEALASICAVSQVDLRTMRHSDSVGTRLIISGSKVESQTPEACAPGSNMMVKNLFFNVPARRKFLKKDSVEMSNIIREFERLALVNTQVEMQLIHNDVTLHNLPKGNLKQRIVALFGKSLNSQLIPVETDTALVRLSGFIVRPEHCRKRGALQYLFVNGRNMRHPVFHKAIMQCYEGLIPADAQPLYFIDFTVEPSSIDVNIHPTKNEIKFEQEMSIRQILYAAVKETLGRFNTAPAIDFENLADEMRPDIPAFDSMPIADSATDALAAATPRSASRPAAPTYNPFDLANQTGARNWEELYANFTSERATAMEQLEQEAESLLNLPDDAVESAINTDETPAAVQPSAIIRVQNRYAVMPDARGLRIIDLHRAHVTVLYERFMDALNSEGHSFASQRLIFPEQITLEAAQEPLFREIEPQLTAMGFDLAELGDRVWAINAVPSVVDDRNPVETLSEIITEMSTTDASGDAAQSLRERVALALAESAAMRADRPISQAEIEHLVADLMSLSLPGYTPGGAPTFTIISAADIEKMM